MLVQPFQWPRLTILFWGVASSYWLTTTITRTETATTTNIGVDAYSVSFDARAASCRLLVRRQRPPRRVLYAKKASNDNNIENDTADDEDDDDGPLQPYRNRSLSWTNKYRALVPYEQVRSKVIAMGFYSKADWDEYVADGSNGPYIPNHPDEMYAADWTSWDEFLGLMRNHDDAKSVVQHVLKVTTLEDYTRFVEEDPKRAEHLRIPLKPHIVYRDRGWISYDHFFGTMQ